MTRTGVERRQVLKGALAGATGLAALASGCGRATLPQTPKSPLPRDLDPEVADALLGSLDRRLAWIDQQTLPSDVLPLEMLSRKPGFEREIEHKTILTRKALRSLYLTGRFIDLPDELKAHPGVQARVASLEPDMDDAVLGMTDVLERMSPDDHKQLQRRLRSDRRFGERLARYVERPAVGDRIPFRRRFGMRAGILQLTERMQAQSPVLVTDPLVRKVRRIQARPRTDAAQMRLLAARMGEEAFWAHQEKMALLHDAWLERLGESAALSASYGPPPFAGVGPPPARVRTEPHSPGKSTVNTGGIIMGFGAGSVVAGLIFWGLAEATAVEAFIYPALVLGVTIGPILLLVGLIVVIVGALMVAGE
jgi:hypothetical protein